MIKIISIDQDALPNRLLDDAKKHMRVDWSYDDDFIKLVIRRAIGRFQNVNDVTLNMTAVEWTPRDTEFCDGRATIPVRPVYDFTAQAGDPPADVSDDFDVVLKWDGIHGVPIQSLVGAYAAGLVLTLQAGVPGGPPGPPPDLDIAPAALDAIFRYTAHLYEHREILIPGRDFVAPDLKVDATLWTPRA